jgi:predicted DNA-binding transcriptional regulator YafY
VRADLGQQQLLYDRFDGKAAIIKHYRVDKMLSITVLDEKRDGQDAFQKIDLAQYSKKMFSMFNGEEVAVRLEFSDRLMGVVVDRFGEDVIAVGSDEGRFSVTVNVVVSPQFLGWVCSFGDDAKILSPTSVVEEMKRHLGKILREYGG